MVAALSKVDTSMLYASVISSSKYVRMTKIEKMHFFNNTINIKNFAPLNEKLWDNHIFETNL